MVSLLLALVVGLGAPLAHAESTRLGTEFQVNTTVADNQRNPTVAVNAAGASVVIWEAQNQDGSLFGIYGQRYDANGQAHGPEFRINTFVVHDQFSPAVAMDAIGNFVVAWQSSVQDPNGTPGVYAQRISAAGLPQGGEFRVNATTARTQGRPAVAMDPAGNFVVAWQSAGQDGSFDGIFARRFSASGTARGGEFQVNTHTVGSQSRPSVAMDAEGDFVIAWQSDGQDGSNFGIFARRYNAAGQAQGGEFRVNGFASGNQTAPEVAMNAAGQFVIAWQSDAQDGSNFGIFARRYNAAGQAQGGEFRVNGFASGNQTAPDVATDLAGNFVIVWQSSGQDGNGEGIFARRHNASGVAFSSEFRVNSFTSGNQAAPSIGMSAGGNYLVAWQSDSQDRSLTGVFAQRFGADEIPSLTVPGNQTIFEDTSTGPLAVTVGDAETPAGSLVLLGSSSDQALVPNGNIVIGGSGSARTVTVTPATDRAGSATITLTVSDGTSTATGSFQVTVTPLGDSPRAAADLYTVGQDRTLTVRAPGVLANDGDPDPGANLRAQLHERPRNGTLTLDPSGAFIYRPRPGFLGLDMFTYRSTDGAATSAVTAVSIRVLSNARADLSVAQQTGPGPFRAGGLITYTLTVRNNGPDGAPNVFLEDTLPANVSLERVSPSRGRCFRRGAVLICSLGGMGSGESAVVQVTLRPNGPGTITNAVRVLATPVDPNSNNNRSSVNTTVNP